MLVNGGDLYQVTFSGKLYNQHILTTFGYKLIGVTGPVTYEVATDELKAKLVAVNGLEDKFLAVCPNDYTLEEIWIQRIYTPRLYRRSWTQFLAGQRPNPALMSNLAMSIERRGEAATRSAVGRVQVPVSAHVSDVSNGAISVGLASAAGAFGLEMIQPIATTTGTITWNAHILNASAGVSTPITAYKVQTVVRTMHRRTVGLGE